MLFITLDLGGPRVQQSNCSYLHLQSNMRLSRGSELRCRDQSTRHSSASAPARPRLPQVWHTSSSNSSSRRGQLVQATSSVIDASAAKAQSNPLSTQPSTVSQRPATRSPAPAVAPAVLTMDSIARATNQEQQVPCDDCRRHPAAVLLLFIAQQPVSLMNTVRLVCCQA